MAARSGSKHLEYLLQKDLTTLTPNLTLDAAYSEACRGRSDDAIQASRTLDDPPAVDQHGSTDGRADEQMILSPISGRIMADRLGIPAITVEIERAVWQVEREIQARQDAAKQK